MIDQTQLDAAKASVTVALQTVNANKAKLLTHDGKPILEPAAHSRAVEKAGEPLRAAVEKALAVADSAMAEVEAKRLSAYADGTSTLNVVELDDANRLARFIQEDCQTLSLDDLAQRVAWVLKGTDKARRFVTLRYAVQRWKLEEPKTPQPAGFEQLGAVLRSCGALAGPQAGLSPELQRLQESAAQLKRWARGQLGPGANGTGRPMGI